MYINYLDHFIAIKNLQNYSHNTHNNIINMNLNFSNSQSIIQSLVREHKRNIKNLRTKINLLIVNIIFTYPLGVFFLFYPKFILLYALYTIFINIHNMFYFFTKIWFLLIATSILLGIVSIAIFTVTNSSIILSLFFILFNTIDIYLIYSDINDIREKNEQNLMVLMI